jgi:hypothetical protein
MFDHPQATREDHATDTARSGGEENKARADSPWRAYHLVLEGDAFRLP